MSLLFYMGAFLIVIGALCDFFGALGLLRFPNFYVRLHAATVGIIGGAAVPLFGVALLALGADFLPHRYAIAGASFVTGIVVLIVSPAGSHALAYAAHKAGLVEWEPEVDHLEGVEGDG
ncbi:monovalent cation/H(+) antiporter subunit G [Thermococcus sp. M36]|uniref:monovalent cation/H(+) antiporter subunit G n=1 Tax=Thermococcus sp. M36 TaxID=1638261 RepID=UPI0031841A2A